MKYVIITGATGGLGLEFSRQLAKANSNLILTGRSLEKLNNLKSDLLKENLGIDVQIFPADLSKEMDVESLFSFIKEGGFEISRLINVAGVDTQMPVKDYTLEKLLFQINVNFTATVLLTKLVLDLNSPSLEVLTVSSMCGITPMPYFSLYSATKSALINFFDGLRYEYKGKDVYFTTLLPGSVPTRPDIVEDIKKQGLTGKLSSKSPEFVVKTGLNALKKHKKRCIPGVYNKIVYFFSKITPYSIQAKIIAKKFSKKQKDHF